MKATALANTTHASREHTHIYSMSSFHPQNHRDNKVTSNQLLSMMTRYMEVENDAEKSQALVSGSLLGVMEFNNILF